MFFREYEANENVSVSLSNVLETKQIDVFW